MNKIQALFHRVFGPTVDSLVSHFDHLSAELHAVAEKHNILADIADAEHHAAAALREFHDKECDRARAIATKIESLIS